MCSRRRNTIFRTSILKASAAVVGLLTLASCATNPQEAINIAKPKTLPARNLTNFSESLRCMDRLFVQFDRSGLVITSAGIPDETAAISAGTKDMLISAISRMSRKSDAFTFVDYDSTQVDVHELQGLAGFDEDFVIPDFYIRGAITQLDGAVVDESVNASLDYDANFGLPEDAVEDEDGEQIIRRKRKGFLNSNASASANQIVSVVSLDLNIGDLTTRQILSGISAHNSIAVGTTSVGGGLGGQISKLGASFSVSLERSEGLHQAVRTLIELSTIEVLGKLAEVPFWRCLEIDHTNPAVVAEAREWFEGMDDEEQIAFVQNALAASGEYQGSITSVVDDATREATARYQAQNDLIADGRINFDLYASLINRDVEKEVAAAPVAELGRQVFAVKPAADTDIPASPLAIELEANVDEDEALGINAELEFSVVTNQDAYVYCYYADAAGRVARVFPNQFQPDSFLPADEEAQIPGEDAGFDIILEQTGGEERVACVASTSELALRLPDALKQPDLMPIPSQSLDNIVEAYRSLDPDSMVHARLDLKVR